ncbi:hypothetical protein [Bacillus safensis]|uniref:hypothetical protein n=1 Tax=Bacillus safensis TaxID=561879 RepID=UPI000AB71131|nr:hypothetical protein [Bacillus safensis]
MTFVSTEAQTCHRLRGFVYTLKQPLMAALDLFRILPHFFNKLIHIYFKLI